MNFIFRKAYFCPSNATPSVLFITSLPIVKIILFVHFWVVLYPPQQRWSGERGKVGRENYGD